MDLPFHPAFLFVFDSLVINRTVTFRIDILEKKELVSVTGNIDFSRALPTKNPTKVGTLYAF
jgi:hypothetical protein